MVRLNLHKGVSAEVANALKARATPMLTKHGITQGTVSKGAGQFRHQGTGYEEYYVLSFKDAPESFPVRRYVAYRDGSELKLITTLRDGFTVADLEAEEAAA